jgi:glycosyltransferase involved in cell wall biosynthesis
MKLLFVHQHLGAFGGAESNILLSATELGQRGHQLSLLHESATGKNEAAWRQAFPQCFQFPAAHQQQSLSQLLSQLQPDLIYLHKLEDLDAMERLIDSGFPTVRMVHDHDMYCMRSYKYNYFTRQICTRAASLYCIFPCLGCVTRNRQGRLPLKWASYRARRREIRLNQRCSRLVAYSEYARQELVRNGFAPDKIQICVPIRCPQENQLSSLSSRNLILYAGQIIRGKGVDLLLRALSQVRVPFECFILGDGSHRAHCEQLSARLGLNDRVRFLGFVPQEELKQYYLQASVFTISSVWPEPFGMVGPEAMRFGVPVVGFNAGGIGEWLLDGENGFLVPWKNCSLFAQRIEELLTDKELAARFGRAGRERVYRQYESSQQVLELEKLFQRVLREHQTSETPTVSQLALCEATV